MNNLYSTLSDLQKEIVFNKEGKCVVRACPGSGKTFSISAKLAYLIENWKFTYKGIAAMSFTNVAWKEIEKKLNSYFNINTPVEYPHFLGTIDRFINKFIFLPFGHLIMNCEDRPILVGEPHGSWSSGRFERDYDRYFDKVSFNINNEIIPTTNFQQFHFKWKRKDGTNSGHVDRLYEVKKRYWKEGYATQDDANYISMEILDRYPKIAKALVKRFPYFIIDEAQDTSEIQMRIIDTLINNGLQNIMLVGDPDQAIYEWNDAKPELFNLKFMEWRENSIVLNENRRSSRHICSATYNLSTLDSPSIAIDPEVSDFDLKPQVRIYQMEKINELIDEFIEVCKLKNIEINQENVAVLYRSKEINNILLGNSVLKEYPWLITEMHVREFINAKFQYDKGQIKEGLQLLEKAFYKAKYKKNYTSSKDLGEFIENVGFVRYRKFIFNLIKQLPKTDCTVNQWVKDTNKFFKDKSMNIQFNIKHENGNIMIKDIFNSPADERNLKYKTGTVHTTKGETYEAVLLLLKQKGANAKYYRTMLANGEKTDNNEELRIVYVGLTRPRKILMIGVLTENDKDAWETRLGI